MGDRGKNYASLFKVGLSIAQAIPSGVPTVVNWDQQSYDMLDEILIVNPWTFTPKRRGYYWLSARLTWFPMGAGVSLVLSMRLNGGPIVSEDYRTVVGGVSQISQYTSLLLELDETDVIDILIQQNSGLPRNVGGDLYRNAFEGWRVR